MEGNHRPRLLDLIHDEIADKVFGDAEELLPGVEVFGDADPVFVGDGRQGCWDSGLYWLGLH